MKLTIDGRLPGLNEYIALLNTQYRQAAAKLKRETQDTILWHIKAQRLQPITQPVVLHFTWYEENKKRDIDNVAFAKKFLCDALVESGVLRGDGWKEITGFTDTFAVDKMNPRIEIFLEVVE